MDIENKKMSQVKGRERYNDIIRITQNFFFQAEDGIRDVERSRGLGGVYKGQTLYSFDGSGYAWGIELNPSFGYWLRFNEPGSEIISGLAITQMDVTIHEGWNLISSITFPVEINNISDPEGLIISGTIYGFDESYVPAGVLEPGKGYWLRSSGDGVITLITAQ